MYGRASIIPNHFKRIPSVYLVLICGIYLLSACTGNRNADNGDSTSLDKVDSIVHTDNAPSTRDLQTAEGENVPDTGSVATLMMQETDREIRMGILNEDLFEGNTIRIKSTAHATLNRILTILNEKGTGKVMITGHSGIEGDRSENQKLSAERAKAVMDWLIKQQIDDDLNLSYQGVGDRYPMLSNTNKDATPNLENQRKNQRLEVVVRKVVR